MSVDVANKSKPFLHWIGSKRRIVNKLIEHLPQGPHYNYYEPFLGGGALFFQVRHLFKQCFLSDINLDLITSYNAVKNNPNEVNRLLSLYHKHHSKDYYYKVKTNIVIIRMRLPQNLYILINILLEEFIESTKMDNLLKHFLVNATLNSTLHLE
ncbi:D12 class N6 adenine-specific DNA methyltransferase family protein [Orientia tsutsugamushi str. Gilliam]|uniref:site-specific DNA-methyltransferase (adenine-specific) n=1 Tax=Orientia tsutsugamushi str. Gilliam TaxID=1359184 RepID=A0A0F3MBN5_ORITS|nr:D12 class N6 adenine-specific DNA methyltransferase family protein [Orientia tsutsugamushi str. Gilliam]